MQAQMPYLRAFSDFLSVYRSRFSCLYRFGLFDGKSLKQPPRLLRCQQSRFGFVPRPLEPSVVQSLVQQQVSVSFPQQPLHSVAPSPAKQKQAFAERVKLQLPLNDRRKPVYSFAQIRIACYNIHLHSCRQIVQHNSRTNAIRVSGATPHGSVILIPSFSIRMFPL